MCFPTSTPYKGLIMQVLRTIAEEAALHSDSSEDDGLMIGGQQEQKET